MEGLEMLLTALLFLAGSAALILAGKLYQARKSVRDMNEALEDIRNGNLNRRMLAAPDNIVAPFFYKINAITEGYRDTIAELNERDQANRQMMTSLSHDVRTPLTTLIGYLDAVHSHLVRERSGKNTSKQPGKRPTASRCMWMIFLNGLS